MPRSGKKLRILHLTNSSTMGGVEAHLLALLSRLDQTEFDPVFAFLDDSAHLPDSLAPRFTKNRIPAVGLKANSRLDGRAFARLASLLRAGGFDVVHVHLLLSELWGIPLARLSRVPAVIVSVHNRSRRYANFPTNLLAGFNFTMVDRVIAISNAVARHLSDHTRVSRRKLRVIHYGFEVPPLVTAGADGLHSELRLSPETKLIGVVARLVPEKGHVHLLDAMPEVFRTNKNSHLLVIGSDDAGLAGGFKAQAQRLGIGDRVTFLGYRSDVAAILPQLDLFVLPSLTEGFGLAILEAMAAGLPVVSTRAGAIPEIVEEGVTGFLVPPAQPEPLAEAINLALAHGDLSREMGLAGRRRAAEQFSLRKMVSATEDLYREVAREKELVR